MTPETRLRVAIAQMHEPLGGTHCLDFANTLEPRGGPPPLSLPPGYQFRDELSTYEDLVAWAVHKDALNAAVAETLIVSSDTHLGDAREILARAHVLRDAIYRVFWHIAHGQPPSNDDLAAIMREYANAAAHAVLVVLTAGIEWTWPEDARTLARPLWPVARSAVELLATGHRQRIRVCPGPGRPPVACGWLFYDTSKNGTRRWCSMTDCGAATKARLQTARRRAQRAALRRRISHPDFVER